MKNKNSFVFFGTPKLAVIVLEELAASGFLPSLIVTAPDAPSGRKLLLTPPAVKTWAEENDIPFLQPQKFDAEILAKIADLKPDFFVVAAYGKILRSTLLAIPTRGTLNVHPSLLPKYRGPSPILAPILAGDPETGVSIILLDDQIDHGPILTQIKIPLAGNQTGAELETQLAHIGGKLLAETIPSYLAGETIPKEQDHNLTSFTHKYQKTDAEINFADIQNQTNDQISNQKIYRKILAYTPRPGAYFFYKKNDEDSDQKIRVVIKEAEMQNGKLALKRVIPENRKEMDWQEFLRIYGNK